MKTPISGELIFFVLLLIVYLILEILWLFKKKESFFVHAMNRIIQILHNIADEIIKGKKGQRVCGIIIALQAISAIVALIIFFHFGFTTHNIDSLITLTLLFILVVPPIILVTYYVNRRVISYCNKNFQ